MQLRTEIARTIAEDTVGLAGVSWLLCASLSAMIAGADIPLLSVSSYPSVQTVLKHP